MTSRASWVKVMIQDPHGAFERLRGEWDRRQDRKAWKRIGMPPHEFYRASPDAEQQLHAFLGIPWPCPEHATCAPIIEQMNREFALGKEFATNANTEVSRL